MLRLGVPAPAAFTTLTGATPALGDSSTNAATTAFVTNAVSGVLTLSTTGGTTTLTQAQASMPVLIVTGALTSNAAVVVPNTGVYAAFNRTTGAFSLTIKTAAGTGIGVTQGTSDYLLADGANVVMGDTDLAGTNISASTVQPSGTATVATPLVNVIKAPYRPEVYGAKLDNATNDTTAWTNMLADITTAGGGDIYMPFGTSLVNGGALKLPSNTTLRGGGDNGSVLKRATAGVLLDISGTNTTTRSLHVAVELLKLEGADLTGTLIRSYYGLLHTLRDLYLHGTQDAGMQFVETWDSNYTNIFCEYCGQSGTNSTDNGSTIGSEVIQLWGATAATGLGASTDSNNDLRFTNLHCEPFKSSALSIRGGVGRTTTGTHTISFDNCKFETGNIFASQYVLQISAYANNISFRNIYGYIQTQANAAFATTTRFANFYPDDGLFFYNSTISLNSGGFCDYIFRFYAGFITTRFENILTTGTQPTGAIMFIEGGTRVSYARVAPLVGSSVAIVSPAYGATESVPRPLTGTLTAAGTTQATALALTTQENIVTTVAVGSGVILPSLAVGTETVVRNRGANALLIYPPTGAAIEAAAANASVSLAVGSTARFTRDALAHWYQG